jgi:hypothetical protein
VSCWAIPGVRPLMATHMVSAQTLQYVHWTRWRENAGGAYLAHAFLPLLFLLAGAL